MAEANFVLKAEERKTLGKQAATKLRAEKKLPAIIYGPDMKETFPVTIGYQDFEKLFEKTGRHHIIKIEVGGKKIDAILKDYIIHPVTRKFLHVDFLATSPKKAVITEVPLSYIGTPVGVKEGGALFVFARKLKVKTMPNAIPDSVEVDIAKLKIKQYLIVRDIPTNDKFQIMSHEGDVLVEVK